MATSDEALNELLYGAVLLDDGVKYYADWASAMQREFHGAASRLPRMFELAQQLVHVEIVQRPDGARRLLGATPTEPSNPYASPSSDAILASAVVIEEQNVDRSETIAALERRIRELERRLDGSMLHSERFGFRVLAVFGHWAIAYVLLALAGAIVAMAVGSLF